MSKQALDLLVRLVISRHFVHEIGDKPLADELISFGFIQRVNGDTNFCVTQRGVDAAHKYAEGQKTSI